MLKTRDRVVALGGNLGGEWGEVKGGAWGKRNLDASAILAAPGSQVITYRLKIVAKMAFSLLP